MDDDVSSEPQPSRLSRITGCLLAGAVGDALGAVVEFSSMAEIRRTCGKKGIQQYAPCYGQLGRFTDDTQMTLFTAEGLLQARQRGNEVDEAEYRKCVLEAYIRWLGTQGTVSKRPELAHIYQGVLWDTRGLHARRAPGGTCLGGLSRYLGSLESGNAIIDLHPLNHSKGCGGVMRMAPVGFVSGVDHFSLGCELAKLSHGHVSGYLPSGYLAMLIHHLVEGVGLMQAIELSTDRLMKEPGHEETLACITLAGELAASAEASPETIERIGAGWVAEEALAISLFCAIKAQGFEHGLSLAVNHSGDSDSTGAITGNILGALHGREYIPDRWIEPLELRKLIETVGQQCASAWP
ncbi:MAG: ADP-ribosylglycohydrolase family protein [Armatimonadota bacterium]